MGHTATTGGAQSRIGGAPSRVGSVVTPLVSEPIAYPRSPSDALWGRRVRFDFFAERSDEHAQMLRLVRRVHPQIAFRMARCVSTRPGCCARYVSSSNSFGVRRTSPSRDTEPLAIDRQPAANDRASRAE